MKSRYKIIASPTQMHIERFGYKSDPIDIADEPVDYHSQKAKDFYYAHMHAACVQYIRLRRDVNAIQWGLLKNQIKEVVAEHPNLYFDGPDWIVSTVPWKHAKFGEWFIVSKKIRWLLKKEYTNGTRNANL